MTISITAKAFSAALAIIATTTSFAGVASAKTYEFTYSPVELATTESKADLQDRIARFARHACADTSRLHTPKMKRECREEMAAQVEGKIWGEQN